MVEDLAQRYCDIRRMSKLWDIHMPATVSSTASTTLQKLIHSGRLLPSTPERQSFSRAYRFVLACNGFRPLSERSRVEQAANKGSSLQAPKRPSRPRNGGSANVIRSKWLRHFQQLHLGYFTDMPGGTTLTRPNGLVALPCYDDTLYKLR